MSLRMFWNLLLVVACNCTKCSPCVASCVTEDVQVFYVNSSEWCHKTCSGVTNNIPVNDMNGG